MSHWTKESYRILLSNGDHRRTEGESNGLFAFDSTFTLTHLETGGKVAQLVLAEAAKRVGDYLKDLRRSLNFYTISLVITFLFVV